MATADPALRKRLYAAKLAALVRSRWSDAVDAGTPVAFPGGAALVAGGTLWALAEETPARSLGGAVLLARRHEAEQLHLLVDGVDADTAGTLARRGTVFRFPITVWAITGTTLAEAAPDPVPAEPPLPDEAEPFRVLIERGGAEAIVEGGILRAEVRGLEVARVEVDEEGVRLAVGVGKYDREAKRVMHGDQQGWPELFEVVQFVSERRVPGREGSPAYHLGAERWLRSVVIDQPHLVGAARLAPVAPPVVRRDLREIVPAPAAGVDEAGDPILVLCSVGIDLDLVPTAADAWLAHRRRAWPERSDSPAWPERSDSPRVVLCVPEGDDHPALHELAALLEPPTEVVTVPTDWRAVGLPARR